MTKGCVTSTHAAQVTFTSWGGSYRGAEAATAAAPFSARTGIEVRSDTCNGGIARIRSQVETGNVVDLQLADATRACDERLLGKADVANFDPANRAGAIDVDVAFRADHADDLNGKFAVWLARK